jgi:serine/threonine protein kinase
MEPLPPTVGSSPVQLPDQVPTQRTNDKVVVARDYTTKYYDRVVNAERLFQKEHSQAKTKKLTIADFELLTLIGRGAFGEVRLCRRKGDQSGMVFAIKILRKDVMIRRNQIHHVRAERDLLVSAKSQSQHFNQWCVELYNTFQDERHLYIAMEFCPGGDMMGWLIKYDVFEEDVARFYTAELVLAVQTLHMMGYAHRDLKPDNILIDGQGHIKLSDFGLSKQTADFDSRDAFSEVSARLPAPGPSPESTEEHRAAWHRLRHRTYFFTTVGSPGYIAPEVLLKRGYGKECDWWGVGIILYEMLCGYPPFYDEEPSRVTQKIVRHRDFLDFPRGRDAISSNAMRLIQGLLTDPEERLTFEQIIAHPFFSGIDWSLIRSQPAPFSIKLKSATDTSYFEEIPEHPPQTLAPTVASNAAQESSAAIADKDHQYLFIGFTSKFDQNGQSTHSGPRRQARPPIADFRDE